MEKKQETTKPLRAPAPPSAIERQRRSEFMVACASGDLDKVEEMLADGADPNYVSDLGGTPLTWAVAWEREAVVECLLSNGAEVELPSRPAWSPLMHAAARGNSDIVSLLIAHGADPRRRDQDGQSPVDVANDIGWSEGALLMAELVRWVEVPCTCVSRRRTRPYRSSCGRRLRGRCSLMS